MRLKMRTVLLLVALGLLAFSGLDAVQVTSRSCSFMGVFLVEGPQRYALNYTEAQRTCESLEATLASQENIELAYEKGMETCRYGWISSKNTTILRKIPHPNCANNQTGIINLFESLSHRYDAYCYDENDQSEKNCKAVFNLVEKSTTKDPTTTGKGLSEETTTAETPVEDKFPSDYSTLESISPELGQTTPSPQGEKTDQDGLLHMTASAEAGIWNVGDGTTTVASLGNPEEASGMTNEPWPEAGEHETTVSKVLDDKTETTRATFSSTTEESTPKLNGHNSRGRMGTNTKPSSSGEGHTTPDWLIILAVVIAVVAILLVCAAIVTRNRWCGKHQTLMITKEGGEGNGAAPGAETEEREQEMVTLMHKENIQENGNKEEFTVIALEESPEKPQTA